MGAEATQGSVRQLASRSRCSPQATGVTMPGDSRSEEGGRGRKSQVMRHRDSLVSARFFPFDDVGTRAYHIRGLKIVSLTSALARETSIVNGCCMGDRLVFPPVLYKEERHAPLPNTAPWSNVDTPQSRSHDVLAFTQVSRASRLRRISESFAGPGTSTPRSLIRQIP